MRRMFTSLVGLSVAAGAAGLAWGDAPVVPGGSAPVQVAAGGRFVQSRPLPGRAPVRRYRSYSIDPGTAGGITGPAVAAPRPMSPAPSSSGRPSTPSYMRADSKARGRFHP